MMGSLGEPILTTDEGDSEEWLGLEIREAARPRHTTLTVGSKAGAFVLAIEHSSALKFMKERKHP